MIREKLPHRHFSYNFPLSWQNNRFDVSVGLYEDGRIAEAFLNSEKVGSDIQSMARDGSILVSLALQFGAPLETIRHAITRGDHGEPQSLIGELVDAIENERKFWPLI